MNFFATMNWEYGISGSLLILLTSLIILPLMYFFVRFVLKRTLMELSPYELTIVAAQFNIFFFVPFFLYLFYFFADSHVTRCAFLLFLLAAHYVPSIMIHRGQKVKLYAKRLIFILLFVQIYNTVLFMFRTDIFMEGIVNGGVAGFVLCSWLAGAIGVVLGIVCSPRFRRWVQWMRKFESG